MSKRIDWRNPEELEVIMLGMLGQSTQAIQEATNRSPGQIAYRLRKRNVKRAEFRDGRSTIARDIIKTHGAAILRSIR